MVSNLSNVLDGLLDVLDVRWIYIFWLMIKEKMVVTVGLSMNVALSPCPFTSFYFFAFVVH